MSRSRFAPHQIRSRYLHALNATPIPVHLTDPPDPMSLTVLGTETIADRTVHFGTIASAPRMWIAFNDINPALLGYITGLVVGEPDLWVCNETHRDWTLDGSNSRHLKQAAAKVWFACQRDCEG
ncbi:hypothetical protein L0U85_06115 [Glycomyces sp. L485]|uniref:hypothetical protein n=1 Tax=Glycomyces sp. L485 TaxID=2909235 RepID=UPI001F4A5342|nr:hypothetical protein [Glycomyces sp. L485]MCH7230431.1 hypothetical protein [Glycomyces sp. L485]